MKPKAEWAIDSEAMKARGIITSVEREVKDSRGSGMYQSCLFFDKIGHVKTVGFRFYSAI